MWLSIVKRLHFTERLLVIGSHKPEKVSQKHSIFADHDSVISVKNNSVRFMCEVHNSLCNIYLILLQ